MCNNCLSKIVMLKPTAFIHAVGIYENELKKAVTRFKYGKKIHLSKPLGSLMNKYAKNMVDMKSIDIIIPVPLHTKRLHERGFNQSELLSLEISRYFGVPTVTGILHRIRETLPQFDLPPKERFKNIKGSFMVGNHDYIKDKRIMLVDDIYTTGSTISECTRVLKEAQAAKVHVLTLSRALML